MQDWNEIPVDVFDDPADPVPPARPVVPPTRLPFDLYLDDPETGERRWIYAAGTALESFRERWVGERLFGTAERLRSPYFGCFVMRSSMR